MGAAKAKDSFDRTAYASWSLIELFFELNTSGYGQGSRAERRNSVREPKTSSSVRRYPEDALKRPFNGRQKSEE